MKAVELADFRSFARSARRSRLLQLGLLGIAIAVAAVAFVVAPRSTTPDDPLLVKGSSTIVVIDLSASISWDTYARIATTLDHLRQSRGKVGLIMFSDTAYEALPPGTPAVELAQFERFFVVRQPTQPGFAPQPPPSPWTSTFSAGTRISTGLGLALQVIQSEHLTRPRVVLISDLNDDTTDLESLTSTALAYRHLGVPISVAALNPSAQDARTMQRLLPHGSSLVDVPLSTSPVSTPQRDLPASLILLAALLGLALAAATLATQRLRWVQQ